MDLHRRERSPIAAIDGADEHGGRSVDWRPERGQWRAAIAQCRYFLEPVIRRLHDVGLLFTVMARNEGGERRSPAQQTISSARCPSHQSG
jgi:hypothetical protein